MDDNRSVHVFDELAFQPQLRRRTGFTVAGAWDSFVYRKDAHIADIDAEN
ncbi:hypothetical protein [Paraburkholderia unamae]|uniref:Uncharacterized protein n=1 Tax=Paraburkholderia unamae TaxID=219649 RepID=A0ACC6RM85_9BURK